MKEHGNIIWFDLETTGLGEDAEIIQAAFVVTGPAPQFEVRQKFEVKIQPSPAGVEGLKRMIKEGVFTPYDPELWAKAWNPQLGLQRIVAFLGKYKEEQKVSKRTGKPYLVARVAGHNILRFDLEILRQAASRYDMFLPVSFHGLDTLALASALKMIFGGFPEKLTVESLAAHYGIEHGQLHDALEDVEVTLKIGRKLVQELAEWE